MDKRLLFLILMVGMAATSMGQWHTEWNIGGALPTHQQTGLVIPYLDSPSGPIANVGIRNEGGLDINVDISREVSATDGIYLDLNCGLIFGGQRYTVDSFAMTESFIAPSLNVLNFVYVPVTAGVKFLWFDDDHFFGWGFNLGLGAAYQSVKYGLLEMNEADDFEFRIKGMTPCLAVGVEMVLVDFMTIGLTLRKFGNGDKGYHYFESVEDNWDYIAFDPAAFRTTMLTIQCGFRF